MTKQHTNGNQAKGFQFPGDVDITVMGDAAAALEDKVPELLAGQGIAVHQESVSQRPSSQGNYVAVRVRIHCRDRQQYELAHKVLRAVEGVHGTL